MLDDDAPVPARLAIEIDRLRAGLLDAARRLHGRADHVIVEDVAEHERHAARRIRAESIRADADGRLADALERQLGLVIFDLIVTRRGQALYRKSTRLNS